MRRRKRPLPPLALSLEEAFVTVAIVVSLPRRATAPALLGPGVGCGG